ncbi:unnamed protein product [Lepidochelys olivacea]
MVPNLPPSKYEHFTLTLIQICAHMLTNAHTVLNAQQINAYTDVVLQIITYSVYISMLGCVIVCVRSYTLGQVMAATVWVVRATTFSSVTEHAQSVCTCSVQAKQQIWGGYVTLHPLPPHTHLLPQSQVFAFLQGTQEAGFLKTIS